MAAMKMTAVVAPQTTQTLQTVSVCAVLHFEFAPKIFQVEDEGHSVFGSVRRG